MTNGVPESRFYMWRAVFAMAHADHVVTAEERAFMENYLQNVPFSDVQRAQLRQDMEEPQHVDDMFFQISNPEDQGEFFMFARELCWSDGDFDAQEEAIKERLLAGQMDRMNIGKLETDLKKHRAESKLREREWDRARKEAMKPVGLGEMLRGLFTVKKR